MKILIMFYRRNPHFPSLNKIYDDRHSILIIVNKISHFTIQSNEHDDLYKQQNAQNQKEDYRSYDLKSIYVTRTIYINKIHKNQKEDYRSYDIKSIYATSVLCILLSTRTVTPKTKKSCHGVRLKISIYSLYMIHNNILQ